MVMNFNYRNNYIKVIMFNVIIFSVRGSCQAIIDNCLFQAYILFCSLKQFNHLILRQPNGFSEEHGKYYKFAAKIFKVS